MNTGSASVAAGPVERAIHPAVADILLRALGRSVQRLLRHSLPPSLPFIALCLLLIHLLSFLVFQAIVTLTTALTANDRLVILAAAASLPLVTLVILLTAKLHTAFVHTVHTQIAPALASEDDRVAFKQWLAATLGLRRQLGLIVIFGGLIGPLVVVLARSALVFVVNPITLIVAVILGIEGAICLPSFLSALALPFELSRYQLKLGTVDPANSELVERLYRVLIVNILSMGAFAALITLWLWVFGLLPPQTALILLGVQWLTIVTTFTIGQYGLALIIRRVKQLKLNEIQARITQIEQSAALTDKDSVEMILRLLDYYRQVKAMRGSALDIGAVLSFLQSLLLPLIASLLASVTAILQLVKP
jgi:hypothetical protein